MIRPSSFQALLQCGAFESAPAGADAARGTERHKALAALLASNDPLPLQSLPDEDREGVEWAVDYVRANMTAGAVPDFERKLSFLGDDFETVFAGTPDIVAGPDIFDLKWRWADYSAQMAAYAAMVLQAGEFDQVTVHLLFAESKRAEKIVFTIAAAMDTVRKVLESAKPNATPKPNDFCGWCAKRLTCPAVVERVGAVVRGREDWALSDYHASDLTDEREMAKALTLARLLADWCEAVEHHAKEMVFKQGKQLPGFKIQERRGNRHVVNVRDAFAKAGLPQDDFLAACDVKFSKLVEAAVAVHGMKKTQAERDMEAKLGETLQRKNPSFSLVKEKE